MEKPIKEEELIIEMEVAEDIIPIGIYTGKLTSFRLAGDEQTVYLNLQFKICHGKYEGRDLTIRKKCNLKDNESLIDCTADIHRFCIELLDIDANTHIETFNGLVEVIGRHFTLNIDHCAWIYSYIKKAKLPVNPNHDRR